MQSQNRASIFTRMTRRDFLHTTALGTGVCLAVPPFSVARAASAAGAALTIAGLPRGSAPPPVALPHFPSRLHAYVWRNWQLTPLARMARAIGAKESDLRRLGRALGLPEQPRITPEAQRRSALTVIRRNWHLLPYEQLLGLLDWTPEQMAFTLREDDFLYIKLGSLKPNCPPLHYTPSDERTAQREREIAGLVRDAFPAGLAPGRDPLFGFIPRLSTAPRAPANAGPAEHSAFNPRYCYSYFALYGDPLLERSADPYPDGYLARMAAAGVNGVWLQGVLSKLALFPWEPATSARHEERLDNLRRLVARAHKHGIGLYLYLNEPRAMPLAFYGERAPMKGVVEGDYAALCTSDPKVQGYLRDAVAAVCKAVPDLAGLFTITGSENLTHCWSHGNGAGCPRCAKRAPAEVIAELNTLFRDGIRRGGSHAQLIAWDWGWADGWVEEIIKQLPSDAALMTVSEWGIPIQRGGVANTVGEYSLSTIGPGARAQRHWEWARKRGLKTLAKVQLGNTWELSAVPYIPAVQNVARHAANLRTAGVNGLMLGWTLGGYPSPNLEVVAELGAGNTSLTPELAMLRVAERRHGPTLAAAVAGAWRECSAAFSEFPFHGGLVYNAPMQFGPSNLLWAEPTGYHATMIGFPYDDLDGWRQNYPAEVFIGQFDKVAAGFEHACAGLKAASERDLASANPAQREALASELDVIEAAAIHFRTTANQARFVRARRALASAKGGEEARAPLETLEQVLRDEDALARRLHAIQCRDSRIGFEASNQYYYVPLDLVEKTLNCRHLLDHWLPELRRRWPA